MSSESEPRAATPAHPADQERAPSAGVPAPEAEEFEDRWRRALADLDNLRKRCAREVAAEQRAERARVCRVWLSVLDNLDRALDHVNPDVGALAAGVRAVRDQAVDLLASLG